MGVYTKSKAKGKGQTKLARWHQKHWYPKHKELVESFFLKGYRLRYSGGMVADFHQILCKGGGIFSYPATTNSKQGKFNLFEVFPIAYIFKCSWRMAIMVVAKPA